VFLMSTVALYSLDDHATKLQLRYEPGDKISDTLPKDSVPDSFLRPDQGIELVSIPADEAPKPQPSNPKRIVEAVDQKELIERLDADRLLLSEIRKAVPENRVEAEGYLRRLKELAGKSDPVRLVPLANRVLDQAPIYFDWLDKDFATQDEQITEYYVGGARGFSYALENFRTAVMFTIMNRLDLASQVLSEIQAAE